jgi:hypothetical protein
MGATQRYTCMGLGHPLPSFLAHLLLIGTPFSTSSRIAYSLTMFGAKLLYIITPQSALTYCLSYIAFSSIEVQVLWLPTQWLIAVVAYIEVAWITV